jgi:hypothetical protein
MRAGRRLGLAVLLTGAAVLLAACGAGNTGGGQANQSPPGNGSAFGSALGSASAAATAAPDEPLVFPTTAGPYAQAAMHYWNVGDAGRLGQLSDPGNAVFGTLNSGNYNKNFVLYQCTGAAGSSICAFYNQVGDEVDLRLRNELVGHPRAVVDGQFHPITFPDDLKAYAQEAITAWTNHNTAAVALLTGKPGDSAFSGVPASHRNDTWTFDSTDGAAGHLYYVFGNAAGDTVVIGFVNPGLVTPPPNRHGLIENVVFQPHP